MYALLLPTDILRSNSQIDENLIGDRSIRPHSFLSIRPDGLFFFDKDHTYPELPVLLIENGTQEQGEQHKDLDTILYTMRNMLKVVSHKLNRETMMYGVITSGPYATFVAMNSKMHKLSSDDLFVFYYELTLSHQLHLRKDFDVVISYLRMIAQKVLQ